MSQYKRRNSIMKIHTNMLSQLKKTLGPATLILLYTELFLFYYHLNLQN